MSDKYPRVHKRALYANEWRLDDGDGVSGGLKVVPADAIVIERDALPEVHQYGNNTLAQAGSDTRIWVARSGEQDTLRSNALALLALAEYRREHPPVPPVDEAEVQALLGLFRAQGISVVTVGENMQEQFRRILATGRVHVDTEGGAR